MQLTFNERYLSINEFVLTELPTFTLVTGLNGSGKTHLLHAIAQGKISADIAPQISQDIRFLDWTSLVPQDTGAFDSHSLVQERTALLNQFDGLKRQFGVQVFDALRNAGLRGNHLNDLSLTTTLSGDALLSLVNDANKAHAITAAIHAASTNILNHLGNGDFRWQVERAIQRSTRPAIALTRQDLDAVELPNWGKADLFQQALGRLFVAYRDLKLSNRLKQYVRTQGRDDVIALSDAEFIERYMVEPWLFVNSIIAQAGLDFAIDKPDEFGNEPYEPKLKKLSNGAEIYFRDLSSGEKVLMSFTLCLYYAEDKRQIATYPKLLLLDEVDAPLHPSMSRTLLKMIVDTLVTKHNIHVIMTTHSPSTVALAPEDSIYAMRAQEPGLHKSSKAQALNILTSEVPTIAISYDGRRQVFVESENDARVYAAAYQALKPQLGSERSLEFISTGMKAADRGSEIHSGCAVVTRLVETLSESGNGSVFGLIDWDGRNQPANRIFVLAHNKRNGSENVFLDPLAIAALVLREIQTKKEAIGFSRSDSYAAFLEWPNAGLQRIVDRLQELIFGPLNPTDKITKCNYLGDFSLEIRDRYLTMDDHELEVALQEKIPELKKISKGRNGALMLYVAENLYRDQPKFVPVEIHQAFLYLLEEASHH